MRAKQSDDGAGEYSPTRKTGIEVSALFFIIKFRTAPLTTYMRLLFRLSCVCISIAKMFVPLTRYSRSTECINDLDTLQA